MSASTFTPSIDYDHFLREHVLSQPHSVMRYDLEHESLWVKRAGALNPAWRYRVLAGTARALGLPVLLPVPNPGGSVAVATEVQRLQDLAQRGLRAPQVLASNADGFVMRHLGHAGQELPSLGNAMEEALPQGSEAVLDLWCQGLQALAAVHRAGTALSQAFARNMVRCPDGVIGYIDFEDDPAGHLPLPVCHVRDALCYVHSTAWILDKAHALPSARGHWQAWVQDMDAAARIELLHTVHRMRWAGWFPLDRKLGRDAQRIRLAYELLHSA